MILRNSDCVVAASIALTASSTEATRCLLQAGGNILILVIGDEKFDGHLAGTMGEMHIGG